MEFPTIWAYKLLSYTRSLKSSSRLFTAENTSNEMWYSRKGWIMLAAKLHGSFAYEACFSPIKFNFTRFDFFFFAFPLAFSLSFPFPSSFSFPLSFSLLFYFTSFSALLLPSSKVLSIVGFSTTWWLASGTKKINGLSSESYFFLNFFQT